MTNNAIAGKGIGSLRPKVENRFSAIAPLRKEIIEAKIRGYKVFKNSEDFVVIQADTASQAVEKSGISRPFRVVRLGSELGTVLDQTAFEDGSASNSG